MAEYEHGFAIDADVCDGCLACMRACPTNAIRVKYGTASVLAELCIDCGSCLTACPHGAITAQTVRLDDFRDFSFRVAIPSPVLFGQFPPDVRPDQVVHGLLAAGFDAVWDYSIELGLISRATVDCIRHWQGQKPLISNMCPVIVELLQVSYPRMLDQLLPIVLPRQIAARQIKQSFSRELGLPPEEIAAIYVTPCQAKTTSILRPAGGGRGFVDGAVGIAQMYNTVLAEAQEAAKSGRQTYGWSPVRSAGILRWATPRPLAGHLGRDRYLSVTGLPDVIKVFDDIEKGRLRGIDYLECRACWGGCTHGNLTVDNVYVAAAKLENLINGLPEFDAGGQAEVERRYRREDLMLARKPEPRPAVHGGDLRERVRRVKDAARIREQLPGLDCGLCGAPSCDVMAEDIAGERGALTDCVFISPQRIEELRHLHHRQE